MFLTPLEPHERHVAPLSTHKTILLGDYALPPPPQRRERPKVRPYVATRPESHIGANCHICGDSLETRLATETLVLLLCGDCVHSECLAAKMVQALSRSGRTSIDPALAAHLLECHGTNCVGKLQFVDPINLDELAKIVGEAVLQVKLRTASEPILHAARFPSQPEAPVGAQFAPRSTSVPMNLTLHAVRNDRESNALLESVRHRLSVCTTETASVRLNLNAKFSLEALQAAFLKYMVENCAFDNPKVALGPLRLVDRLLIEKDGHTAYKNVYLFANYMVMWVPSRCKPEYFALKSLTVRSPLRSLLELTNDTHTLVLLSDVSSIVEKWGIALSDPEIDFPSDLLTSTIVLETDNAQPPLPSPHLAKTTMPDEVYLSEQLVGSGSDTASPFISRETSPLVLCHADTASDSDSDSDQDIIEALAG